MVVIIITVPVLQMRKLRLREMSPPPPQYCIIIKWQVQHWSGLGLTPEPEALNIALYWLPLA